ncbi:hypothetical protein BJ878DRAFT_413137 [Calycina marina]|uniref:Heterokaryon incompatibility domain-containing protein n=1 Tax=Calycina marina TaxID=1763456 RepID=A0A9P7ZAH7_9HELO|nr:hypothetical protein BJ878DRAFT_413137 [Calycina marina]
MLGINSFCIQHYDKYGVDGPTMSPARLIRIINHSKVFLCHVEGPLKRYTTVSYCWSRGEILNTTRANVTSMQTAIDWDKLLKAVQDVISLTWKLDVSYIWIDSLCIIQDDREDWIPESRKMSGVKSHSWNYAQC